ncbi:hypothetical protein FNV43_RR02463 [Rhamnella rubrinervis]|uniref:EF-hand domain-containing protein n=1 Tax=Rhamnella rubrinervis TaxID=2594499 RepID=A0A8K0HT25_9ROSA|nr:hypothetical protein FNV43_RR02463 [Rhamnella rubrinervis]
MSMYNQTILAANAYYNNGPKELKERIWDFFKSVDTNRDGGVSFDEFLHYLHQSDYIRVIDPRIFTLLDVRRDGSLEFSEFLTFYYILESYHRHVSNSNTGSPTLRHHQTTSRWELAITKQSIQMEAFNIMQQPSIRWLYFRHHQTTSRRELAITSQSIQMEAFNIMQPPSIRWLCFRHHQTTSRRELAITNQSIQMEAFPLCSRLQSDGFVSGTTKPPADSYINNYAAAFNPMALFQAPPNHRRRELAITNQSIHMEAYNNMQPPVCLNQVPTIKPGASSCCCCGSNNKELMPAVVAYKPPLSKSEKRSKVAKKTGKAVVHCASVVGATAAALALL